MEIEAQTTGGREEMARVRGGLLSREARRRPRDSRSHGGGLSGLFFSSRRRHTRYWRDWSSDVCSSDLVRTARPSRRASQAAHAAPPERPRGGATSASGSGRVATWVISDRDLVELVLAQRKVLVRLQSLHVLGVGVDLLPEAPDDVPALVVLDLLRLVDQLRTLGLVDLARRRTDQLTVLLVVPVGLVVGAALLGRERAHDSLRDVVAGVPEVLGERVRQVVVVVERRLLGHLDVDAGLLGLLGEQVGRGDGDRADVVAGEQLDLEPLGPGLLEQRLGLLDVLLALRQ